MYQYFRNILIVLFILIAPHANASQNLVAAVVDNEPITEIDIKKRSELMIKTGGLKSDVKSLQAVRGRVLEVLIDEILIRRSAHKANIKINDEDIDYAFNSLAEKNKLSKDAFIKKLKDAKIDIDELKKQLAGQIIWGKLIAMKLQPDIEITPAEIAKNRREIEEEFKMSNEVAELKLAEIAFYVNKEAELAKKMEFANKLYNDIKSGADFESVARQFSQGINAKAGGVIGWLHISQINPGIANFLQGKKAGFVTEPIAMEGEIHIFKILEKRVQKANDAEISDEEIKEVLINRQLEGLIRNYIRNLRRQAHIEMK